MTFHRDQLAKEILLASLPVLCGQQTDIVHALDPDWAKSSYLLADAMLKESANHNAANPPPQRHREAGS